MLKNYNYILTIMLYPFMFLLGFLILNGNLQNTLYQYLLLIMIIIFIPSFIMSLYHALDEIIYSKKKWRILLLIIFPFFYLPIYYTIYVSKQEKYLGFILCILSIVTSCFTYRAFNIELNKWLMEAYKDNVVVSDNFTYISKNNLFSINVSQDFRCLNKDIGDYVISCDKIEDDSFIGIYSYDISDYDEKEVSDILDFHINQSLEYIKESGYEALVTKKDDMITIDYHDMVIFLTQNNYIVGNNKYSLIVFKEMPKSLENENDFKKMIETIYFLNYNEEVSS